MTDPYGIIAERFEELFPCPVGAVPFVMSGLRLGTDVGEQTSGAPPVTDGRPRILDIGCATGEFDRRLAHAGAEVVAIDTSQAMISLARERWTPRQEHGSIRFEVMDMRAIGLVFAAGSFDAVLCLGNTLPHLEDLNQIRGSIAAMAGLPRRGGVLVLQLLDYEGVAPGESWSMPPVEIPGLVFRRSVRVESAGIDFVITVEQADSGQTATATQRLVPVARSEIEAAAAEFGLEVAGLVAGFDDPGTPAARSSYVLTLAKPA